MLHDNENDDDAHGDDHGEGNDHDAGMAWTMTMQMMGWILRATPKWDYVLYFAPSVGAQTGTLAEDGVDGEGDPLGGIPCCVAT